MQRGQSLTAMIIGLILISLRGWVQRRNDPQSDSTKQREQRDGPLMADTEINKVGRGELLPKPECDEGQYRDDVER